MNVLLKIVIKSIFLGELRPICYLKQGTILLHNLRNVGALLEKQIYERA